MAFSLCVLLCSPLGNHKQEVQNCRQVTDAQKGIEGVFSRVRFKLRITLAGAGCVFAVTVPRFSTAAVQSLTKRGTVLFSLSQSISRPQPNT